MAVAGIGMKHAVELAAGNYGEVVELVVAPSVAIAVALGVAIGVALAAEPDVGILVPAAGLAVVLAVGPLVVPAAAALAAFGYAVGLLICVETLKEPGVAEQDRLG